MSVPPRRADPLTGALDLFIPVEAEGSSVFDRSSMAKIKDPKDQEVEDRAEREKHAREDKVKRERKQGNRAKEENLRPERFEKGVRPARPRPEQLIHAVQERQYLRFNEDRDDWEQVERHRRCDHWVKKGDPAELHTHPCVGGKTPTVVFYCQACDTRYRVARDEVEVFKYNHKDECPTCHTALDEPRDAIDKDFR